MAFRVCQHKAKLVHPAKLRIPYFLLYEKRTSFPQFIYFLLLLLAPISLSHPLQAKVKAFPTTCHALVPHRVHNYFVPFLHTPHCGQPSQPHGSACPRASLLTERGKPTGSNNHNSQRAHLFPHENILELCPKYSSCLPTSQGSL